jgi:hypothetical protein
MVQVLTFDQEIWMELGDAAVDEKWDVVPAPNGMESGSPSP